MATFLLVHPAWLGGWCWRKVSFLLRVAGHSSRLPTLTGLGERSHLAGPDIGLGTHIEDIVNTVIWEELEEVILVGTSSAGMVITGVADRVADRIAQVVYLDAFVPEDGESLLDIIPPDRRAGMEQLVASEGKGWLLPRFGPEPWEQFLRDAWHVTDAADLRWMLPRLRPTPFGHFTESLQLQSSDLERTRRAYIRCRCWPNARFDRYAEDARSSPDWTYRDLDTSHLPYITDAEELQRLLLDLIG